MNIIIRGHCEHTGRYPVHLGDNFPLNPHDPLVPGQIVPPFTGAWPTVSSIRHRVPAAEARYCPLMGTLQRQALNLCYWRLAPKLLGDTSEK